MIQRTLRTLLAAAAMTLGMAAHAAGTVGNTLPADFPVIVDTSLGKPVIGFGAAGPVSRTPVIFLHGNNDTPFPTACNPFGRMQALAQYLADNGYATSELWGLGYQGDQCDLAADQTRRSRHRPHQRRQRARPAPLRLRGDGLHRRQAGRHRRPQPGRDLAREWMRQDEAQPPGAPLRRHRRAEPRHHQLLAQPFELLPAAGLRRLHAEERGLRGTGLAEHAFPEAAQRPRRQRRDRWPDQGAGDPQRRHQLRLLRAAGRRLRRRCRPRIRSASRPTSRTARCCAARSNSTWSARAPTIRVLGTAHLGILNSPQTWQATLEFLSGRDRHSHRDRD